MAVGKPRPAARVANKLIAPPVAARPVIDVLNVAHVWLSGEAFPTVGIYVLAYSKQTCKQCPYETLLTRTMAHHTACLYLHNRIVTNNFPSRLPPAGPSGLGLAPAAAELVPRSRFRTDTIVKTKQSSGFIVSLAQVSPLPALRWTCASDGLARPCRDDHC